MLTNADGTLYNRYVDAAKKEHWLRTVLSPIRWEANKGKNIMKSGISNANGIDVWIWQSADAGGRGYLEPKQFAALSSLEDARKHWTLDPASTRIVRGIVPDEPATISEVTGKYDAVMTVKSVDVVDYGPEHMRKWLVSGA